ncbi:MAG: hypothetical protein ACPKPY_01360, partial [Nitrososphaeraceae archaeon]
LHYDDYRMSKNKIPNQNKFLNFSNNSSSLVRNSILLFPSALGIEILCILASITGESIGFYLFGFNVVGIIYAYSLGFTIAGFAVFLIILGRYSEHKSLELGCHDNHQFQLGFKSNFIATFRHFKNGCLSIPWLVYNNKNRTNLLKKSLYLLLTAESICIITAQTVDLLFYNVSVFLSIPLALLAGAFVIALQQAEEIKKINTLNSNMQKTNNNINKKQLKLKIVPITLAVNALLIMLFVINGGYNHYDNGTVNSNYHTHLISSTNETFFSAPDLVVVETDEQGTGIYIDYISIVKPDSNPINQILNIPSSRHIIVTNINSETHPEGDIRFNNNQTIRLDFSECHNQGCIQPQEILNVYTTHNTSSNKQIIEDRLEDHEKIFFVNSSKFSFNPNLSQYAIDNNHHELFDKLVIHTKQKENIEAFYITNVNSKIKK